MLDDLRSPATNVRGRSFRRERLFDELLDITFTERVKHLDVVERSRALSSYLLGTQALATSPPRPSEAEEHFFTAFEVLRYSLSASPKDPWLCTLMADTCSAIWALVKSKLGDSSSAEEMLETSKLVNLFAERAESYFTQALQIDGLSVFVLRRYGSFLQQRGQLERAEEQLLKCMQIREHQGHTVDEQAVRELILVLDAKKDTKLATQLRQKLARLLGRPDPPTENISPRSQRSTTSEDAAAPPQHASTPPLPQARSGVRAAPRAPVAGDGDGAPPSESQESSSGSGTRSLESSSNGGKSPRKMLAKFFSASCVRGGSVVFLFCVLVSMVTDSNPYARTGKTKGREPLASDSSIDVSSPTLVALSGVPSTQSPGSTSGTSTPLSRDSGVDARENSERRGRGARPVPGARLGASHSASSSVGSLELSPPAYRGGGGGGGAAVGTPEAPVDTEALRQRRTTMRQHLENMCVPGSGKQ